MAGAGPAGMAAALAAAERGALVTLVDGEAQLGGQYWRRPAPGAEGFASGSVHREARFRSLARRIERDGRIERLLRTDVWAIEARRGEGVRLRLLQGEPDGPGRRERLLRADRLVLACGAHDRTLPFPGWTLPGVTTGGAAQAFLAREGLAIGERVVVGGAGPFLLPVALGLAAAGARVLGVHEAAGPRLLAGWLARPWELLAAGGKALELAQLAAGMVRHRIPYRPGSAVVAAHGRDRVEAVTVARLDARWRPVPGTARRVACDAVCASHGFSPRLELAVAAGCSLRGGFVRVDEGMRTDAAGVFAAGEVTGVGGAVLAEAEGRIAGHCAAGGQLRDARIRTARRVRASGIRFAARLERVHAPRPGWPQWLREDTTVCRCEGTSYGRLREVAEACGSEGTVSLKLLSRAGLGPCQGRICGPVLAQLLAGSAAGAQAAGAGRQGRPLAGPLRLGELAEAEGEAGEAEGEAGPDASQAG